MLALKKKRDAEKKKAEEEAAAGAAIDSGTDQPQKADAAASDETKKVSLFGIGGEKKGKKGAMITGTKKTPGEIRIQKGELRIVPPPPIIAQMVVIFVFCYCCLFLTPSISLHVFSPPSLLHIDIGELDGGKVATISFPNPNDLTSFNVTVCPDTGYWAGATYEFVFTIPPHYPHSPPKVECKTKIYHPNIDLEGKVCLNILREDWRPVLDINSVIYGLIYLFYEPNPVSVCVYVRLDGYIFSPE
jgi:ubiquitin-conjugating enzyme E2 M